MREGYSDGTYDILRNSNKVTDAAESIRSRINGSIGISNSIYAGSLSNVVDSTVLKLLKFLDAKDFGMFEGEDHELAKRLLKIEGGIDSMIFVCTSKLSEGLSDILNNLSKDLKDVSSLNSPLGFTIFDTEELVENAFIILDDKIEEVAMKRKEEKKEDVGFFDL